MGKSIDDLKEEMSDLHTQWFVVRTRIEISIDYISSHYPDKNTTVVIQNLNDLLSNMDPQKVGSRFNQNLSKEQLETSMHYIRRDLDSIRQKMKAQWKEIGFKPFTKDNHKLKEEDKSYFEGKDLLQRAVDKAATLGRKLRH